MNDKKRIFSGIQPSGNLHLGNYLGAIKNWMALQDEYESIFCVVDMHAITVPQDPKQLRQKTIEIAKIYLASGIDPKKATLFIQSHIKEHAELMWILNTVASMGELEKMTQFKDKSGVKKLLEERNLFLEVYYKNIGIIEETLVKDFTVNNKQSFTSDELLKIIHNYRNGIEKPLLQEINSRETTDAKQKSIGVGLFNYPVLMAADILLYDTQVVPVGEDQVQHIELTRDIAKRFNHQFGDTFIIPEAFVKKEGMRIMGLDDPNKKMSKSASSEYNYISLIDDEETVRRKIKKAVTDNGSEIVYADDKPAIKNLLNIYSLLSNKPVEDIVKDYQGKGYGDFKTDLADVVVSFTKPFQEKLNALTDEETLRILQQGAEKVRPLAEKKMQEVKEKIGFVL